MKPERKPEVVDFARYKRAAQDQAKRKAAAPSSPKGEPLLGSRPRAGLILMLAIVAMAAFWAHSNLH